MHFFYQTRITYRNNLFFFISHAFNSCLYELAWRMVLLHRKCLVVGGCAKMYIVTTVLQAFLIKKSKVIKKVICSEN